MQEKRATPKTGIHVDDYAISLNASREIAELIKRDKVNGISIIPNFDCFTECINELIPVLLSKGYQTLKISVHLNFMEGKSCSPKETVSDLVDRDGFFTLSWGSLLTASYSPLKYQKLKEQLKREIKSQIQKVVTSLPDGYRLRIDSHQHTHVIPIVFNALKEVIKEENYDVEYIRLPAEPLLPYLKNLKLYKTYSVINIIKNILLNTYSAFMKRWVNKSNYQYSCLWGVVMSGKMNQNRVENLLEDFREYASAHNQELEILFHAGSVLPAEITLEYSKPGFRQFHLAADRRQEWNTIDSLSLLIT